MHQTEKNGALVIGFGSIGERHYNILSRLFDEVNVLSRRQSDSSFIQSNLVDCLQSLSPSYVVVATETSSHLENLDDLLRENYSGTVLVEKPLFHKPASLNDYGFKRLAVGYHLRFNPLVRKLRKIIANDKVISVQSYVGQFLPSWRCNQSYKDCYSAKSEFGGGVLSDLSHEFDLITWLFGEWTELVSHGGKVSNLVIQTEDCFSVLLKTKNCEHVNVNVNYLDHALSRTIKVLTNNHSYTIDLVKKTFEMDGAVENLEYDNNDAYINMHLAVLDDTDIDFCNYEQGLGIVLMIDAIKKSNNLKEWLKND